MSEIGDALVMYGMPRMRIQAILENFNEFNNSFDIHFKFHPSKNYLVLNASAEANKILITEFSGKFSLYEGTMVRFDNTSKSKILDSPIYYAPMRDYLSISDRVFNDLQDFASAIVGEFSFGYNTYDEFVRTYLQYLDKKCRGNEQIMNIMREMDKDLFITFKFVKKCKEAEKKLESAVIEACNDLLKR